MHSNIQKNRKIVALEKIKGTPEFFFKKKKHARALARAMNFAPI